MIFYAPLITAVNPLLSSAKRSDGKNLATERSRSQWLIQGYISSHHLYQSSMIFPVSLCTFSFLTWAGLLQKPLCLSQRTDQQIYRGINTGRYVAVPSWDPFTEARASHWLMDKKWIKHLSHSAGWGATFAWVPHIRGNKVKNGRCWLLFVCTICLPNIVSIMTHFTYILVQHPCNMCKKKKKVNSLSPCCWDTQTTKNISPYYYYYTIINKDIKSYHWPDSLLRRLAVDGWPVSLLSGFHQPAQPGTPKDGEHLYALTASLCYCTEMFLWKYLPISCEILTDSLYFHLIPTTVTGRSYFHRPETLM